MLRKGDGWKLSVRIRFIHARVRQLMKAADEWNTEDWGTPISAAHMGFSTALFSDRLLEHSTSIGATYSQEEKDSIVSLWRYVGYLMGVPEAILHRTRQEAQELFKIGFMCEPPPDEDAATVANAMIQSIPLVAGLTDPGEQDSIRDLAYRISRALVGNQVANRLHFPRSTSTGVLYMYRAKQLSTRLAKDVQQIKSENFLQLLNASNTMKLVSVTRCRITCSRQNQASGETGLYTRQFAGTIGCLSEMTDQAFCHREQGVGHRPHTPVTVQSGDFDYRIVHVLELSHESCSCIRGCRYLRIRDDIRSSCDLRP